MVLSGSDEVPDQFRKLVEQYYRSLAQDAAVTRRVLLVATLATLLASAAAAQFGRGFGGFGGLGRVPPRYPTADTFGPGFVFCRGIYTSGRREAGGSGWTTDYPDADINFSIRLSELTRTRVKKDPSGRPDYIRCR